jgi:hypothetical protein
LGPTGAEPPSGMRLMGAGRLADAIRRIGDGDWD